MKTLYLECNMGAAGDMLCAALSELIPDPDAFFEKLNGLDIPKVNVLRESAEKCGIVGTHIRVLVDGEEEDEKMHAHHHEHHEHHDHGHGHDDHHHDHHHSSMEDIEKLISSLDIPEKVKSDAKAVYRLIAQAEAHVHGREIGHIHFHEVGTMDAVADVVAVCMLMNEIAPDRIVASPVHVGTGQVRCAHGILPVPAPATAYILRDVPIYGGDVKGELCTPTGAALLKHFADEFAPMPVMKVSKTGYGMGTKDFERANVLRAMLGEAEGKREEVFELSCNLDDMTGEDIASATEILLEAGALDVFTTAIGMKKGRPGVLLSCICKKEQREMVAALMFKHTTTIGIRERAFERYTLERREIEVKTALGNIRAKESFGFGVKKVKPEHDDLAEISEQRGISISEVRHEFEKNIYEVENGGK